MAFPSTTVSMSQMNTERGLAYNTTVSINNTEVKQMAYQYNQPSSTSVNLAPVSYTHLTLPTNA